MGYLRHFSSKMVNAWSSGTGMAGVLGSLLYITFGCVVGAGGDNQNKLRHLIQYVVLNIDSVFNTYCDRSKDKSYFKTENFIRYSSMFK